MSTQGCESVCVSARVCERRGVRALGVSERSEARTEAHDLLPGTGIQPTRGAGTGQQACELNKLEAEDTGAPDHRQRLGTPCTQHQP